MATLKRILLFIPFLFVLISCENELINNSGGGPVPGVIYNWNVSNPASLHLRQDILDTAIVEADRQGFFHSILIIRDSAIAAEEYFFGYTPDAYHPVASVTKTFLSALTGIAIEQNLISLDQKIAGYFSEYLNSNSDPRYYDITVEHLLTMRGGLIDDENVAGNGSNTTNMIELIFSIPLVADPGTEYNYSTNGLHLLSAILSKVVGRDLWEYANANLFVPMGITLNYWERDPQGIYYGGRGMYLAPRNMAVLGMMYMNNGKVGQRQVVPEEWTEESLHNTLSGDSLSWGVLSNLGYGYCWWMGSLKGHDVFYALGYGGNYVLCIPDYNMIIVTTVAATASHQSCLNHEKYVLQWISDFILPAVINQP